MADGVPKVEFLSIHHLPALNEFGLRVLYEETNSHRYIADAIVRVRADHADGGTIQLYKGNPNGGAKPERNSKETEAILNTFLDLLKSGEEARAFTFLKVDIVGHTAISASNPQRIVNDVLDAFFVYIRTAIDNEGGQVASWAGDGGLCVFPGEYREDGAVRVSFAIIEGLLAFNERHPLKEGEVQVRVAIHRGHARWRPDNPGLVHSGDINFVAHLETQSTKDGHITISQDAHTQLTTDLRDRFNPYPHLFEGRSILTSSTPEELEDYVKQRSADVDELTAKVEELKGENARLQKEAPPADDETINAIIAELDSTITILYGLYQPPTRVELPTWEEARGKAGRLDVKTKSLLSVAYATLQEYNAQVGEYNNANLHLKSQFSDQAKRTGTGLREELSKIRELVRAFLMGPQDWDGVMVPGYGYIAVAGPLNYIQEKESEPFSEPLQGSLEEAGFRIRLSTSVGEWVGKMYGVVYLTDQETWKRKVMTDDGQVMMAKREGPSPGL